MKVTARSFSRGETLVTIIDLEGFEEVQHLQNAIWRALHDPRTPPRTRDHIAKLYKEIRMQTGYLSEQDQD